MLVRDVMTSPAHSLIRGAPLEDALQLLAKAHISAVPIVDTEQHVVGIVSEADILRESLVQDPRAHLRPLRATKPWAESVDEVMTANPVCVSPGSDCAEAATILAARGWKSMPVVSDGRLVGVLSRSDLLHAMSRTDVELREEIHRAFAEVGHPSWRAEVRYGRVVVTEVPTHDEAEAARNVAATVPGVRSVVVSPSGTG